MFIYIYILTTNLKGHEFESKQEGGRYRTTGKRISKKK